MMRQRLNFWTGGHPGSAEGCEEMAAGFPVFPPPARLSRAVHVVFQRDSQVSGGGAGGQRVISPRDGNPLASLFNTFLVPRTGG